MTPVTPQALRRRLAELSDARLAAFSAKLIPGLSRPLTGVPVPALRALAKELARTDFRAALSALAAPETHEEVTLRGLIIGYARIGLDEWQRLTAEFVTLIDNWAVCDIACSTFTIVRSHREAAWPFLLSYVRSQQEFKARFGIIMLMDHYLCDDYAARAVEELRRVSPSAFYVEMAVGWALATAFVKYESLVWPLLSDPQVPAATRRMACKKILESKRTTPAQRLRVRALRSNLPAS